MPNRRNQGGDSTNPNSKRGLASADKETRERVASQGGKASAEARRENQERNQDRNSGNNPNR